MRIPRLYCARPLAADGSVELEAGAARHLLTVLRLKPGASLVLFDGSGAEYEARLEAAAQGRARVRLLGARHPPVESPLAVTLAQGISRGTRMDYTVQKATELGVTEIIPLLTSRSVVRLDARTAERKRAHWQSVAVSACEQSGRVRMPAVRAPLPLAAWLAEANAALGLLLDPQAAVSLEQLPAPAARRVSLLVGPEGGLSPAERSAARGAGFCAVRLGPRILRTETAALVALSLLQSRWGDLG